MLFARWRHFISARGSDCG